MSANTCPERSWCEEDHTNPRGCPNFHMKHDRRKTGVAVLRHDLVLDEGSPSIDICESIDWSIPLAQMPAFIQNMRAELDKIEAAAVGFMVTMNPLVRHTEPGEPDLAGRGGGL